VLLSDCDVVFLDNPLTTLINHQLQVAFSQRPQRAQHFKLAAQIAIMSDAHFGHRKDRTDSFGNSGFMFYRAGELQVDLKGTRRRGC
jgi:hypothetical protein